MESRLENYRIRALTVYYYLEDKSIMIVEPKQQDSGVPHGAFLKRHAVLDVGVRDRRRQHAAVGKVHGVSRHIGLGALLGRAASCRSRSERRARSR